ncbi:MAG TPA: aldolase/citrate lyase family protein [Roseiarcus sp.]|nr:aldolase/citrate lyase family protein [Roseiarcus sp.]
MRSLLIAPAAEKRLAAAFESGADALIVDLECAAPADRVVARTIAARFLKEGRSRAGPRLMVRTNALDSGETDADLDAVMAGAPDAIVLAGSAGAPSVQRLSAKLAVREAHFGLPEGATRILAIADTAEALFHMGSYRGSSARLIGIAWSAERLRTEIEAETDRDSLGGYLGPYRLARELTLLAATSAGLAAIDGFFPNIHDLQGLRAEALAARRDGYAGKMAADATQVAVINDVFPPRTEPVANRGG